MAKKPLIVDPSLYDVDKPITTIEDIRKYNRQRYEMEQLTGILYDNFEEKKCVGYKDMTDHEFWVRGHMPNFPLTPGVVLCEVAAQMASYFMTKHNMFDNAVMGFAGLEEVKFRGMVRPGARVIVQSEMLKWRKILITARFMCVVDDDIVCEGILKGVPLPIDESNQSSAE
ncbi:MAG: beta-hydroxyacyl-ACP dehydratase [Thermoguttaceae bacterium]|nr:beta-hydroxyacyl-ACP dehydratase [Thermoguttaceae bacterium]